MAATLDIEIDQGATYQLTLVPADQNLMIMAKTATVLEPGAEVIPITATKGTILAGMWVTFGADEGAYFVLDTGVGTITIYGGLIIKVASGISLNVFVPRDLTGLSARAQIRAKTSSPEALASFTATINNGINLTLPAAVSDAFELSGPTYADRKQFVYDVETYTVLGYVNREANGLAMVSPNTTK